MIIVGEALISEDILENHFACRLDKCKGACCVQGDAGAPLESAEIDILNRELAAIRPFLSSEGLKMIEDAGFSEPDPTSAEETAAVTKCLPGGECVFLVYDNGVAVCGIERAFLAGATDFRKPISCHLYPIRTKQYGDYTVMNYHRWDICSPACDAGKEMQMPLYRFLQEPLERKMGKAWYAELEQIGKDWEKRKY